MPEVTAGRLLAMPRLFHCMGCFVPVVQQGLQALIPHSEAVAMLPIQSFLLKLLLL